MSHTYALLGVSPTAHAEIEALMRAAGYDHAIQGDEIDMHGLALVPDASAAPAQLLAVTPTLKMLLAVGVLTCTRMDAEITDQSAFRRWMDWSTASTAGLIPIDDDAAFIASVDALLAALPARVSEADVPSESLVGLGKSNVVVRNSNVDQCVSMSASGAKEVDALGVDLGINSLEHHPETAASASPHNGSPDAGCNGTAGSAQQTTQGGGDAVTPAMIAAGAEAAREYMQRTGGNSPEVIYRAMRAAIPKVGAGDALRVALRDGIPLQEPVYIAKALLAKRQAKVVLSGGTGPKAAVHLVNIGLTGWVYTAETAEAFAKGYNMALDQFRSALLSLDAEGGAVQSWIEDSIKPLVQERHHAFHCDVQGKGDAA